MRYSPVYSYAAFLARNPSAVEIIAQIDRDIAILSRRDHSVPTKGRSQYQCCWDSTATVADRRVEFDAFTASHAPLPSIDVGYPIRDFSGEPERTWCWPDPGE